MANAIQRPVREGLLASYLGEDMLQSIYRASVGVKVPIAIGGTPFFAVDSLIIPSPRDIQRGSSLQNLHRGYEAAAEPTLWYRGRPLPPIRGGAGFTSLSDLISEATAGGKRQDVHFTKAGPTKTVGRGAELFFKGTFPVPTTEGTGSGGTTGTGRILTSASVGAMKQQDPTGGDQLHIVSATANGTIGNNILLFYDRLWDMAHVLTVDPRSCDAAHVPTRYQAVATAPGSFLSGGVAVVLPAASNTATFDYVDDAGNASTTPAVALLTGAVVGTIVLTTPNWFVPLASGDVGIRALSNSANAVNLSAAYASGEVNWFIGHPLMMIPLPITNLPVMIDGINSAFNLARIYDGACLALMELPTGVVTATTYWGQVILVAG